MSHQLFKRHADLFLHCQFDSKQSILEELIKKGYADFYTFDEHNHYAFVHMTGNQNVDSIKKSGLVYARNSTNHLGDGNYCLVGKDKIDDEDLINFLNLMIYQKRENYSLVFGYYVGNARYCFNGIEGHKGYTVLLDDVPKENITKIIPLEKSFSIGEIDYIIMDELKNTYDILQHTLTK